MKEHNWIYRAECTEVVDGDTVDLRVDLGFNTYKTIRVRLEKVDTAEIFGVEKESDEYKKGIEQKRFVEKFVHSDNDWDLLFDSKDVDGKYGRWIGDIINSDGESLVAVLKDEYQDL